jgi:hypothetical protein
MYLCILIKSCVWKQNYSLSFLLGFQKFWTWWRLFQKVVLCSHFYVFLYTGYLPCDGKHGPRSSKSNEKDKWFEYYFLIMCRHLSIVKIRGQFL